MTVQRLQKTKISVGLYIEVRPRGLQVDLGFMTMKSTKATLA
jgi:hypothetical protein